MKSLFSYLGILLVLICSHATASRFVFLNGNAKINEERRLVLDIASLRLIKLLDVTLPDTVIIASASSQQEFDSLAGGRLPEWGAGAALPARNLILLRESMIGSYPGAMSNLLQHELAHIALYNKVGGEHLPRFIDEGFASWFAGEWTFSNVTTVAAAQITKSILPLKQIDDVNSFHQGKANLAYSQSYLVVFYIFQKYGDLGFLDLLEEFRKGKGINEAFRSGLDISFWMFEADYRKFLSEKYTLLSILADSMGLWIVLAIVVVIGFILIKRRRKNAIDRWREEERFESTDFDYDGSDDEPWKDPEDPEARV